MFAVTSWTMPYAHFENERLVGGIVFDLAKALEQPLGLPIRFSVTPRKRTDEAVRAGLIDLRCYATPKWVSEPQAYDWSAPLFELNDVVIGASPSPAVQTISQLPPGTAVGTVLGYSYPSLEPFFTNGTLVRDDAQDQNKVLHKISAQRSHYAVSDQLALDWYRRTTRQHNTSVWQLPISHQEFACGVPKNGKVSAARIIAALDELKKNGSIHQILAKYR